MIMMRRGLDQYDELMRKNANQFWNYIQGPCIDRIRGKTFGVYGLGRIGNAVAKRANSFDMNVVLMYRIEPTILKQEHIRLPLHFLHQELDRLSLSSQKVSSSTFRRHMACKYTYK